MFTITTKNSVHLDNYTEEGGIELQDAELQKILTSIKMCYGYDFLNYSTASLKRRFKRFIDNNNISSAFELEHRLINNRSYFFDFVNNIMVNVTEMFRDADFYLGLRKEVLPYLSTYSSIKIWHAGCATGEEVFSMAILLKEHGLLAKTHVYATDLSSHALEIAKSRRFNENNLAEYEERYKAAGGTGYFYDYYYQTEEGCFFNQELIKNTVFATHNLATDKSFNEFNLILCRNVLIYFNQELQNKVLELFEDSLATFGFLTLGKKETLFGSSVKNNFETIDRSVKIFRKIKH